MIRRPRRAYILLEYDGKDISQEISEVGLSLIYTDNTDEADTLEISFEDVDGKWHDVWFPKVGERPQN